MENENTIETDTTVKKIKKSKIFHIIDVIFTLAVFVAAVLGTKFSISKWKEVAVLEEQRSSIENEIKVLESEKAIMQTSIENLQKQNSTLSSQNSSLKSQNSSLQSEVWQNSYKTHSLEKELENEKNKTWWDKLWE